MSILILITLIVFLLYLVLIIYYRFAFTSVPQFQIPNLPAGRQVPNIPSTKITVIIPARNEQNNVEYCLQSITEQSYPKELYEVIIVDDHSQDNTAEIVKRFADRNVKLITLQDHVTSPLNSYKKKAIEIAMAQATGTLVVTTDADCYLPARWLETIAVFYEEKKPAFIAGPVTIDCGWKFIEIFQSLDFMTLQGITAAVVHKKQMTMCNGANMAYEREAFYAAGGFAGIDNIASGDDMLLMHKIYKLYPERVMFLKSKEAIVKTMPVRTVKEFFQQRIRWASKADKYDDKRILPVLVLVYIFNCLMLALPLIAVFNNAQYSIFNAQCSIFKLWLLLLILKIAAELFFLFPVAIFFGKKNMLCFFPLMQPFHIMYTVIAGWLGKFGKYTWKERSVQ